MNKNMRRYIPNVITLMRPPLTLWFVLCILRGEMILAVPVFAAICLTDFLDGAAARALKACTRFGAYLDVICDLFYVMASLAALNIRGIAPLWFTGVTALKFMEFAVTSRWMKRGRGDRSAWVFDPLGRYYGVLAVLAPGVFCLSAWLPGAFRPLTAAYMAVTCALAAASSAARIAVFTAILFKTKKNRVYYETKKN